MGVGKTNRRKGSDAERHYASLFRDLGFSGCETSRFVSKKLDNAKVDLTELPFNIQIKAGIQQNMSAGKELSMMETAIKQLFGSEHDMCKRPLLLIHHKQGTKGVKRVPESNMVYMSLIQYDIFRSKSPALEYYTLKHSKFDMFSEFKSIVGITFEVFVDQIVKRQYHNDTSRQ